MYNRQPCVTGDSYQLSHEHLRQLECSGHFRASTEVSPFKFVSGKHQVSDGEKECLGNGVDVQPSLGAGDYHICTVTKDLEFRMRSDVFTESVLDRALHTSITSESFLGSAAAENGKRPLSYFCDEVVNKRPRQEHQAAKLEHFNGNSFVSIPTEEKLSEEAEWTGVTVGVGFNAKSFEAGHEIDHRIPVLDQLEDDHFQFSDHSHRRHVPVGPDHQADLPKWTSPDSYDEASDKWLGTCVTPMPDRDDSIATKVRSCSKICCDCTDEASIKCVRKHVMDAREKLFRELGQEEFIQMGFSHMGEIVAQRWTEEEENLFHQVVLSNPESVGRNFWVVLQNAFPSTNFKELVSYYFNVFMLRKRAHQNRFDRSNVDSDNDEWQESSDAEFPFSEEGEEEQGSVAESPSDGKTLSLKNDASEVEFEERTEADELKSKLMPSIQTIDGDSTDSAKDQDFVPQILPYNAWFWWAV